MLIAPPCVHVFQKAAQELQPSVCRHRCFHNKSSDVKLCPKWYNSSGKNSASRQIILQKQY